MNGRIRPYQPADRSAVRRICCETGFMGRPIDGVYRDREAFADFFTAYYTDEEPGNCLVAETNGRLVGYLLGCGNHRRYRWRQPLRILRHTVPAILGRILAGRYRRQDVRFLLWFLVRAGRETPKAPPRAAHFHINLLPEFRDGHLSRRLIFGFLRHLRAAGIQRVYGQIQTFDDRRPARIFERYGFRLYDRRRVTKFRRFYPHPVYVSTFFCEHLGAA